MEQQLTLLIETGVTQENAVLPLTEDLMNTVFGPAEQLREQACLIMRTFGERIGIMEGRGMVEPVDGCRILAAYVDGMCVFQKFSPIDRELIRNAGYAAADAACERTKLQLVEESS
jgi:hypothetical protein